jgi:hypothetical protein
MFVVLLLGFEIIDLGFEIIDLEFNIEVILANCSQKLF